MITGTKSLKKAYQLEHMNRETVSEKGEPRRRQRKRKKGSPSLKEWGKNLTGDERNEYALWTERKRRGGTPKRRGNRS